MIQAILFDHDGTLVDSEPCHFDIWNQVLEPLRVQLTEAQYKDLYAGMPTPANAVDIAARFDIDLPPATLSDMKLAATRTHMDEHGFPLMPGTRDVLERLRGLGLRMAVVTGANTEAVMSTLRRHDLEGFFETVVSCDDVTHSKPAPDCYLLAAERLGVAPADCVAVEDSEHGLTAAAEAGVPCLVAPTEMSRHHDFRRATAIVDGLGGALDWIAHRVA